MFVTYFFEFLNFVSYGTFCDGSTPSCLYYGPGESVQLALSPPSDSQEGKNDIIFRSFFVSSKNITPLFPTLKIGERVVNRLIYTLR